MIFKVLFVVGSYGFIDASMVCSGKLNRDCTRNFCIKRQRIMQIRGDSVFTFRKRNKFAKMADHFEYNYLPAQLSALYYYHVRSVVCMQKHIIILFLSRVRDSQFAILDLKCDKFVGAFGTHSGVIAADLLSGAISPDLTKCVIRIPYPGMGIENETNSYHLLIYNIEFKRRMAYLDIRMASCLFAFDPRFSWQHLAITNFAWSSEPALQNSISRFNIESWDISVTNNSVCDEPPSETNKLVDIQFSRDGLFIVLAYVDSTCVCLDKRMQYSRSIRCKIVVIDSDTLGILNYIPYHRFTCAHHLCPVNYTPQLSVCGTRMAVVMDIGEVTSKTSIMIYRLPVVLNLQGLCRAVIVRFCLAERLNTLPLPERIIRYLQFAFL